MPSGTGPGRMPSGPGSTSCWRASSPGRRSSPTTPASRGRARRGFWGSGLGYFVPTIPLFGLGAVIAMSRSIGDAPGLLTAIAAGGAASVLALLALTVDESDEAFANVYSGAVSLQNLLPEVPQRALIAGTAGVATIGALLIDLRNYQPFLFLLGSFFVPLFGVLLADWLLAGRHYAREDVFAGPGDPSRAGRRLDRRLLPLPVAVPGGPRLVDAARRAHRPALAAVGRCVAAELRARVRAHLPGRPRRAAARLGAGARMIALLGNLSRDFLPGAAAANRGSAVPRRPRLPAARDAGRDLRALRGRGPGRAAAAARRARNAGALRPGRAHGQLRDRPTRATAG